MMKRLLALTIITMVVASSAYGAEIIRLDTPWGAGGYSYAYSVSEDGRYVGGRASDTDGYYSAGYYDTSLGTGVAGWARIPASDVPPTVPGTGSVIGIGHRSTSTEVFVGANMNDNGTAKRGSYAIAGQFGRAYRSSTGVTTVLQASNGNYSETMVGYAGESSSSGFSGGGAACSIDGQDAWIAASHTQGSTDKGNEAFLYKASANPGAVYATMPSGRNGGKYSVNGVSGTGRVVGWDYGTGKTGSYFDGAGGGTLSTSDIHEVPHIPNYNSGGGSWYAYGISNSGKYAVGYQFMTGSVTRLQGFLADTDAGTAIDLLPSTGAPNNSRQTNVFDATDDGFAIGYDYYASGGYPSGTYQACAWRPWDSTHTAISLINLATSAGISLTGWVHLGTGAGSVTKATVGGHTLYYIAGSGLWHDTVAGANVYRAFELIIPEPATLVFLALGSLAMLRRRR